MGIIPFSNSMSKTLAQQDFVSEATYFCNILTVV